MTENEILKILNSCKSIKPDQDYSERSRMLILASEQKAPQGKFSALSLRNFVEIFRISGVVGIISFLLLFLMGGVSYINKNFSPLGLEGLSQKSLVTEAKDINNSIEITLKQIKYLDQSNQKTLNTISEVSKNQPIYSTTTPVSATSTQPNTTSTDDISEFLIATSTSTVESTDDLLNQAAE
jgi:hypothetical protein